MICRMRRLISLAAALMVVCSVGAQTTADYAVQLGAVVQPDPPQITLFWQPDPQASTFTVSRKMRDASSWNPVITLPGSAFSYVDTNVVVGYGFEYRVEKAPALGTLGV